MKRAEINDFTPGLVADLPEWQAPLGAASDVSNIRILDGAAHAFYQHRTLLTAPASSAVDGIASFQSGRGYGRQLAFATADGKLHLYGTQDGTVHQVYSGATPINWGSNTQKWSWHTAPDMLFAMHSGQAPLYLAEPEGRWYGVPVSNNFELLPWDDSPQTWADANKRAVGMRSFENQLIAFNMKEGGTDYQARVRWSEPYLPGSAPRTWDEGDTSSLANFYDIADTEGPIWDALQLRSRMYVYKSDGIWAMSKTGGDDVYRFERAFEDLRLLISDCVCEFDGKHFMLSPDDMLVHNGAQVRSVGDRKVRKFLFNAINGDALVRLQVEAVPHRSEIWIFYPEGAEVDRVLVWNWLTESWSFRTVPSIRQACLLRPETGATRDGEFQAWAEYPHGGSSDANIYEFDAVTDASGAAPSCHWERRGMVLGDWPVHTFIRRIQFRMTSRIPVTVSVGHQMTPNGAITWDAVRTFDSDTDVEISCRSGGRYHAVRVESAASAVSGDGPLWSMYGMTIEFEEQGDRGE